MLFRSPEIKTQIEECIQHPTWLYPTKHEKIVNILLTLELANVKSSNVDRIADEFIRYNRIKSFLLEPNQYLSFDKITYQVNDNEIIIADSLLDSYMKKTHHAIPETKNKYIIYNTFDMTQPDDVVFM